MARSWKPEVIADDSGKWAGNGLRFRTKSEADHSASSLASQWMLVTKWRSSPSDDEPNYEIKSGIMTAIQGADDNENK